MSRPTAYKWIGRYLEAYGRVEALADRSRRPHSSPEAIPDDVVDLLVKARKARPYWGPVTLRRWLINRGEDEARLPAPSTIGAVLKKHGLVRPRTRRQRTPPSMGGKPSIDADCPNAVWCIDYKGQFRTADGQLCYPLTLIDGFSRYLLRCEGLPSTDERRARLVLESAFREYGLPARIRSDNGSPFASTGVGGLTRLSVWWVRLGIVPDRIRPGHPQENGRLERFHGTLKRETASPPRASMRAQQRAFDVFRGRYNHERPHQALGGVVPDELHVPSTRLFVTDPPDPSYPPDWETRRVTRNGSVSWNRGPLTLGAVLGGELVGIKPMTTTASSSTSVRFCSVTTTPDGSCTDSSVRARSADGHRADSTAQEPPERDAPHRRRTPGRHRTPRHVRERERSRP
ncbi:MAG TPA: integrase core domain-containing protein [Kofleriaceae bacterium]|nr:integrase core domain-containing protein [Kofleriaceae bacterium]